MLSNYVGKYRSCLRVHGNQNPFVNILNDVWLYRDLLKYMAFKRYLNDFKTALVLLDYFAEYMTANTTGYC